MALLGELINCLLFALRMSFSLNQQYTQQIMETIETRQLNDIGTWMRQDPETDLPDILKGVFFMDGNPFPDDCFTLEGGKWDGSSRTLLVPTFTPFQR